MPLFPRFPFSRHSLWILAFSLVFLGGALFRVWKATETLADLTLPREKIHGDQSVYLNLAENLSAGRGFSLSAENRTQPSAYRPPGYAFMLSLLFRAFGERMNMGHVVVAHAALDMMTGLLLAACAFLPSRSMTAAFMAFALYAAFSPMRAMIGIVGYEVLAGTMLAGVLFFWLRVMRAAPRWPLALAAALMLLIHVREVFLPLPFLAALSFWRIPGGRLAAAKLLFLCALAAFPWTWRTFTVTGQAAFPVAYGGSSGLALWYGSWERSPFLEKEISADGRGGYLYPSYAFLHEADREAFLARSGGISLRSLALKNILNAPGEWLLRRLGVIAQGLAAQPFFLARFPLCNAAIGLCLWLAAAAGALWLWRGEGTENGAFLRRALWPLAAAPIFIGSAHIFLHLEPRYISLLLPGMFVLAALGIWQAALALGFFPAPAGPLSLNPHDAAGK